VKLAASQQLFAYWSELRGARGAPERSDIDPGAIRGVLADTFILEYAPGAKFPMRIAGSRTNALFMRELRGAPFVELWRPDDRGEISDIVATVANETQPFLIGASGGPGGMSAVDIEVLLLPLRHNGATHSRILGACAPRKTPEWLGLIGIEALGLASLRALGREERDGALAASANFHRHGHLFVYSSRN
jgi:hypothetical protein